MTMRPHLPLPGMLLLAVLAAGCDQAGEAAPDPVLTAASFRVEYRLEGTYAGCTVAFVGADGGSGSETATLPWSRTVRVTLRGGATPFTARLAATCTDPDKAGKSTASVLVDGAVRDSESNAGPGATTVVSATVAAPVR